MQLFQPLAKFFSASRNQRLVEKYLLTKLHVRVLLALVICCSLDPALAETPPAAGPATSEAEATTPEQKIQELVQQLDDGQYQTREAATKKLLSLGMEAAEPLAQAVRSGSLERANRSLYLLAQLARPQDPAVENPALQALQALAALRTTAKSSLAARYIRDVFNQQTEIATTQLVNLGIQVEDGDLQINSQRRREIHLRIPPEFKGTAHDVRWVSWLSHVEYLVAGGPSIDGSMLEQLVRMPDLKVIALHRTPSLRAEDLLKLKAMNNIVHLELMYMDVGDGLVDVLAKLPLRGSIRVFGVPLSDEALQRLRQIMPLALENYSKSGAFLGVSGNSVEAVCRVTEVTNGSAAQIAGLRPEDIIIKLGEFPIRDYAQLRATIGTIPVGKPVDIEVIRNENGTPQVMKLPVRLSGAQP
jgi:hypothetical protein